MRVKVTPLYQSLIFTIQTRKMICENNGNTALAEVGTFSFTQTVLGNLFLGVKRKKRNYEMVQFSNKFLKKGFLSVHRRSRPRRLWPENRPRAKRREALRKRARRAQSCWRDPRSTRSSSPSPTPPLSHRPSWDCTVSNGPLCRSTSRREPKIQWQISFCEAVLVWLTPQPQD